MDDLSIAIRSKAPGKLSAPSPRIRRRVNRVMDYVQAQSRRGADAGEARRRCRSRRSISTGCCRITGETLSTSSAAIRLSAPPARLACCMTRACSNRAALGFSSAATFARAFKAHFGMSAPNGRDGGGRQWTEARSDQSRRAKRFGNRDQAQPICRKATSPTVRHAVATRSSEVAKRLNMEVEIRQIPPIGRLYAHVGPYGKDIGAFWTAFLIGAHGMDGRGRLAHRVTTARHIRLATQAS